MREILTREKDSWEVVRRAVQGSARPALAHPDSGRQQELGLLFWGANPISECHLGNTTPEATESHGQHLHGGKRHRARVQAPSQQEPQSAQISSPQGTPIFLSFLTWSSQWLHEKKERTGHLCSIWEMRKVKVTEVKGPCPHSKQQPGLDLNHDCALGFPMPFSKPASVSCVHRYHNILSSQRARKQWWHRLARESRRSWSRDMPPLAQE